jgi:hypothetical protein
MPGGFFAAHFRHFHVEQDDVVVPLPEGLQRLTPVVHDIRGVSDPLQDGEDDLLVDRIVLCDQNAQRMQLAEGDVKDRLGRLCPDRVRAA